MLFMHLICISTRSHAEKERKWDGGWLPEIRTSNIEHLGSDSITCKITFVICAVRSVGGSVCSHRFRTICTSKLLVLLYVLKSERNVSGCVWSGPFDSLSQSSFSMQTQLVRLHVSPSFGSLLFEFLPKSYVYRTHPLTNPYSRFNHYQYHVRQIWSFRIFVRRNSTCILQKLNAI